MTDITIVETQPTGAMTMASEMKYASDYNTVKQRLNLHLAKVWLLQTGPTLNR